MKRLGIFHREINHHIKPVLFLGSVNLHFVSCRIIGLVNVFGFQDFIGLIPRHANLYTGVRCDIAASQRNTLNGFGNPFFQYVAK